MTKYRLSTWIGAIACPAALLFSVCALGVIPLPTPTPDTVKTDTIGNNAVSAEQDRQEWRSYNRQLDGNRYSDLSQINTKTVGALREICRVRVGQPGPFSSGIILVDGTIYVTTSHSVIALDPANCDVLWKSIHDPEETEVFNTNRGVGYGNGRVFRGTGDGRLIAYDAKSGKELWKKVIGNPAAGEFISAAPLVWQGKVFIGLSGGDWGIQGRMMAFDANTGERIWTFNTIPGPGEFGNETWPGESWRHGGGGTWTSYALDEKSGELFVPVANPGPDLNPDVRKGDNLFTNAVVVLDARTGRRLWHYQTRKNDSHDYGATTPPVLITIRGGRKVVLQGSKDGYVYAIDRRTHELVYRQAITTILNHDVDPTVDGIKGCPGLIGGMGYNSPAYDPAIGSITVGAVDWCTILKRENLPRYSPGQPYISGSYEFIGTGTGWITSIDASSGSVRWKYHSDTPIVAALTPTAGGLTFAGDLAGMLYAFRSSDGEILYRKDTGGAIAGGIITFLMEGRQYLAVTSGNVSRSTATQVPGGTPSVVIYGLDDSAGESVVGSRMIRASEKMVSAPDLQKGRTIFSNVCAGCHGAEAEGLNGPSLHGISRKWALDRTVSFIRHPTGGMPTLYPSTINGQDVQNVAGYILSLN